MAKEPQGSKIKDRTINLAERELFTKKTPIFSRLSPSLVAEIAETMEEVQFEKYQIIVREGDVVDAVYIIAEGSVEISKKVDEKKGALETLLAVFHQGENIGLKESGLYTETSVRTATAKATSFCILLKINIEDLQRILQKDPNVLALMNENLKFALKTRMIREISPFSELSNSRLSVLAGLVKETNFKSGTLIYLQGELAEKCYMIYEGEVELYEQEKQKKKKPIILEAGNIIGQAAFVSHDSYQTNAKAKTDCTLLEFDREILEEISGSSQEEVSNDTLMFLLSTKSYPIRAINIQYIQRTLSDGSLIVTLKNPIDYSYIQLNEKEWFLWRQLNGEFTPAEIAQSSSKQMPGLTVDDALIILKKLLDTGFAYIDSSAKNSKNLLKKAERGFSWFKWVHFLKYSDKVALFLYQHGGKFLVTLPALILYFFIALAGCYYFFISIQTILKDVREISLFPLWVLIAYLLSMLNIITPLLKAMAIKKMNHDVPHIALIWNRIGFKVYVDASDLLMDSRKPQVIVFMIIILANILAASLWAILAYYTLTEEMKLVFWLTALVLYFLTLRTLNPMQNMVGYALLSNGLNQNNLHQIAFGSFKSSSSRKNFLSSLVFWLAYCCFVLLNLAIVYFVFNLVSIRWPEIKHFQKLTIILMIAAFGIETAIEWFKVKNSQKFREQIV